MITGVLSWAVPTPPRSRLPNLSTSPRSPWLPPRRPFQRSLQPNLCSTTSSTIYHAHTSASSAQLGVLPRYTLGLAHVVGEWEGVVFTLKFPTGVPPEVWGTGLYPSEWRTQNPTDLNALRLAAISNFKQNLSAISYTRGSGKSMRFAPPLILPQRRQYDCGKHSWELLLLAQRTSGKCLLTLPTHSVFRPP